MDNSKGMIQFLVGPAIILATLMLASLCCLHRNLKKQQSSDDRIVSKLKKGLNQSDSRRKARDRHPTHEYQLRSHHIQRGRQIRSRPRFNYRDLHNGISSRGY